MRDAWRAAGLFVVLLSMASVANAQADAYVKLNFVCSPNNDLYRLLVVGGQPVERFETLDQALQALPAGSSLFILAEEYPFKPREFNEELTDKIAAKKLRVYAEFVGSWAGVSFGKPRQAESMRAVVTGWELGPKIKPYMLLSMHDCHYIPVPYPSPTLMLARVAGFDRATFGPPKWVHPREPGAEAFSLLAEYALAPHFIAGTKLSHFVSGRYAPAEQWCQVWQGIIKLITGRAVELPPVVPLARPSFNSTDPLPGNAEAEALRRAIEWYSNSKLLVHPDWMNTAVKGASAPDAVAPFPGMTALAGDGKLGILEGYSSTIDYTGRNMVRYWLRGDCTGENAFALAYGAQSLNDARIAGIAGNLLEFLFQISPLTQGPRANPESPSYGLIGWATLPGKEAVPQCDTYYGDDNARALLGSIGASVLLKTNAFDEAIARGLLANLRTSGKYGFRQDSLSEEALQKNGWRSCFNGEDLIYAPHYQAYLWACYLWAYQHSGYAPFLDRAKTAIAMTMDAYPDKWRWTNGIQQERARMLLPLAWLVRLDDNPKNRQWLQRMAEDLLALQDASGAIREQLGKPGMGQMPPPKSNSEYGKAEAPLIQQNGDLAADLLYTCNFAFLGLHEAAAATGEPLYADAEKKLAEFLCRAQIKSLLLPELDGAWFRAFDFKRWDFWGSDSDAGWGAWSIESGWTQAWISSVFAMRQAGTSFWELTAESGVKAQLQKLQPLMLPPEEVTPPSK